MVQFTDCDTSRNLEDQVPPILDDLRAACDRVLADVTASGGLSVPDFRLTAIHRLRNVVQSALAVRVFQWVIFPNDNFWKAFFDAVPSTENMQDHFRELDMMARFAALHSMFSALESDMRDFVRRIDPAACRGGDAGFASIKSFLLARATSAQWAEPLLELIRLTRNTIHNNGVHRPENNQNATLTVGGRQFSFEVGKPIDFVGWEFVGFVGGQVLALLQSLVTDPTVAALPAA